MINNKSNSLSLLPLFFIISSLVIIPLASTNIQAQSSDPNQIRMIWWDTHCGDATECNQLRDTTNTVIGDLDVPSVTGQKDTLIFHFGSGHTPQTYQISAMKGVTSIQDGKKGFEFFSLAEVTNTSNLQKLLDNHFQIISYDLEGVSPQAEQDDPVAAFESAKQAVAAFNTAHGLTGAAAIQLAAAPSQAITTANGAAIAQKVTWYHIQSQIWQDDDTSCNAMRNYISGRVAALETAKPALEDEISFQVTLTNYAASGKTIYETATNCADLIMNDDVDGFSSWWSDTQYVNGQFQDLYKHVEDTYS